MSSIEEKITTITENTTKVFKSVGVEAANITAIDTDTKKATLTIGLTNGNDVIYKDIDVSAQLPSGNEIKDKLFWDSVMVATGQIENFENYKSGTKPLTPSPNNIFVNEEGWGPDNFIPYTTLKPKNANKLFAFFRFKEADDAFDEGTQNQGRRNNSLPLLFKHANEYYNTDETNEIKLDFSECEDFRGLFYCADHSSTTYSYAPAHLGLIDFTGLSKRGYLDDRTFPAGVISASVKLPKIDYNRTDNFHLLQGFGDQSAYYGVGAYLEEFHFIDDEDYDSLVLGDSYRRCTLNVLPWQFPSKNMKSYEGYYSILSHLAPTLQGNAKPSLAITNSEPSGKNYWWNIERFREAFYYHLVKNWNTELGRELLGINSDTITREDAINWFVHNMQPNFDDNSTYITLPYIPESNNLSDNSDLSGREYPRGAGWTFKFVPSSNGASNSTGRCESGWDIMTHNTSFEADALDQIAFESGDRTEFEARLKAKDMTGFIPASAKMIAAGKDTSVPINEYIKGCQFVYWNEDGSIKDTPEPSMEGYGQNLDTNIY